jgi:hypothetical protein
MLNLILLKYSRLNLAFMAVMFIALTTLLSACGGGGTSGSSSANSATPTTTTPSGLIAPGAYITEAPNGMAPDKTYLWVVMLLPTMQGSSAVTNFYGLFFDKNTNQPSYINSNPPIPVPDLYSGAGLLTNVNSASFTRLSVYSNTSAVLQTGSGTLSLSEFNGLVEAKLRFPDAGSNDRTVSAGAPSNATYNTSGNLNSVNGSWKGRWSYGVSPADEFPLNISAQGDISTSQNFQQYCKLTEGKLAPSAYSSNLLTFTLKIPAATQCLLGNETLNGAAFVTASPVAGKTQRLYIAGVTTDGRGISYIADR